MTDRQKMLAEGKKFREESLTWYDKMIATSEILSEEEKQAFDEWEDTHVDGSGLFSTGDWPGWEKYILKSDGWRPYHSRTSLQILVDLSQKRSKRCKDAGVGNYLYAIASVSQCPLLRIAPFPF